MTPNYLLDRKLVIDGKEWSLSDLATYILNQGNPLVLKDIALRHNRYLYLPAAAGYLQVRKHGRNHVALANEPYVPSLDNLPVQIRDRCLSVLALLEDHEPHSVEDIHNQSGYHGITVTDIFWYLHLSRTCKLTKDGKLSIQLLSTKDLVEELSSTYKLDTQYLVSKFLQSHLDELNSYAQGLYEFNLVFDSPAEKIFYQALQKRYHSVSIHPAIPTPGWSYKVDFLVGKTIYEVDGSSHLERDQYIYDRKKDRALLKEGYHVVRIDARELMESSELSLTKANQLVNEL